MRIAYLCTWEISTNDGVTKKIADQVNVWTELGHEVVVFCVNRAMKDSKLKARRYKKKTGNINQIFMGPSSLISDLFEYKPDFIYLRHEIFKPYLLKIVRKHKTVLELNADDIEEFKALSKKSLEGFFKAVYHFATRHLLLTNVCMFISMTNEMSKKKYFSGFNKPIVVSPNSINNIEPIKKVREDKNINFIFLGTLKQSWQGVDKIEVLSEKLGKNSFFHIVGDAGEKKSTKNIIYHGYRQREEYLEIIRNCDIGIGSLAAHRKGIKEGCALKVREYIASGLPVILAYKDTAFIENKPDWVLEIPNTEDNVSNINNIKEILKFSEKMKNYIVNKEESETSISAKILEEKKLEEIKRFLSLQVN